MEDDINFFCKRKPSEVRAISRATTYLIKEILKLTLFSLGYEPFFSFGQPIEKKKIMRAPITDKL